MKSFNFLKIKLFRIPLYPKSMSAKLPALCPVLYKPKPHHVAPTVVPSCSHIPFHKQGSKPRLKWIGMADIVEKIVYTCTFCPERLLIFLSLVCSAESSLPRYILDFLSKIFLDHLSPSQTRNFHRSRNSSGCT